jgi:D-glycero-D-manno-heptose 1,7-bisphosphate phosphatase
MNKAVFLDRDGVLNYDPGYVHKVEDYKLLPGVIEGLKLLGGFKLFLITNQSGIGRGYYSMDDFHKFNNHLVEDLKNHGIKIEKTYCCPHHPDEKCDCRKPSTKSIKEAQEEFDIDLSKSWVVGDHPHDIKMGKAAGCKTIYMLTGHGKKHKAELGDIKPDSTEERFLDAVKFIIK